MNLQPQLLKFVTWAWKRERDPRRAEAIWREFDEDRQYGRYLAHCQSAWSRVPPPAIDNALARRGFTYLPALPGVDAGAFAADLANRHPLQLLKKDSRDLEGFRVADPEWLRKLLGRVLQGQVDSAISAFFRSEYLVHWVALSLTRPAPEQASVSFRWHCDKGPSAHLKLIVYLNPTEEHGGNTEFIDLEDSMAVARRGYLFGWSKARTSDVAHLSHVAGRSVFPYMRPMAAGDAVLFQPARVLHRGISPTRAPRLTATLCLLPSPVHWQRALECATLSDLAGFERRLQQ
jgi:hypothetical protein